MSKVRRESWEEMLEKQLAKNEELRLLFDEKRFYLQVAHLVIELRTKLGISQVGLAKKAKVSQPLIARLEKGDHRRTPTFGTVHKILNALGYSVEITAKQDQRKAA